MDFVLDSLAGLALTPGSVVLLLAIAFGAALLRGFTGFGFAIAAVPLFSQVIPPLVAVTVAICMQFLGGMMDFRKSLRDCHRASLPWLVAGSVFGAPIGVVLLGLSPVAVARVVIGAITLIAALILVRGVVLTVHPGKPMTVFAGFLAGLFNGLAAMPGPPAVAYYLALPIGRAMARASMLAFFFLTSITALLSALWLGSVELRAVVLAVLGMPVMIVGVLVGARLSRHGGDRLHRLVSIALLIVIAVGSIARGVHDLWP